MAVQQATVTVTAWQSWDEWRHGYAELFALDNPHERAAGTCALRAECIHALQPCVLFSLAACTGSVRGVELFERARARTDLYA